MDKECVKRSISKGVEKAIHGMIINEVWKSWSMVKKKHGTPDDCMCFVNLEVDKSVKSIMHITFVDQQRVFHMPTSMGVNVNLVIACLGDEEALMLQEEAAEIFKEVEGNRKDL